MDIQNFLRSFSALVIAAVMIGYINYLLYLLIIYIGDSINKVLVRTTDKEKAAGVLERRWYKIERVALITTLSAYIYEMVWCVALQFDIS